MSSVTLSRASGDGDACSGATNASHSTLDLWQSPLSVHGEQLPSSAVAIRRNVYSGTVRVTLSCVTCPTVTVYLVLTWSGLGLGLGLGPVVSSQRLDG